MKAATFVFLAVCCTAIFAQNNVSPAGDITIGMFEGTPEYCFGAYPSPLFAGPNSSPDDITLRLSLKVLYENHRSEKIILPSWTHSVTRMVVAGKTGTTVLRDARIGGMNVNSVMAMADPKAGFMFTMIAPGKSAWYTGVEGVTIPVLDHSSGVDLRGKTVQLTMTREFRSLPLDVVEKLNAKWKDYGTVWTGVAESDTLTFRIPDEPMTTGPCGVTRVAQP